MVKEDQKPYSMFKLIFRKKSTSLPQALIVLLRVGVDETRDSGGRS